MKKLIFIFFFGSLLTSCKIKYSPRIIKSIAIQEFKRDSTSIRAIEAIDVNTIYYAGSKGDVVGTTDSGITWKTTFITHQDSIIPHFRSIAKNKNNLFVLSIESPALLYKISNNKTELVYKEDHEAVFYDSMKFFEDKKHGIAIGDPTEDCPSIILTSDAGTTWQKISCDSLPKLEKGEAFFAASNTNICIKNNIAWMVTGGTKARVFKSTDFGKTWRVFNTPFIQGKGPQGIYSIDFYDILNGIAIGGDYANPNQNTKNKAITHDGGKTWRIVADKQNPSYKSCVQYVPDTNGKEVFAVGKTGVSFSNDSGLTWTQVSEESYYAIQFVDKNTAWLSGNKKIGKLILKK